jgi:hypothetical protein
MLDNSVGQVGAGVKSAKRRISESAKRPVEFVGELVGLFPETDPERFMRSFDYVALRQLQVKRLVLAHDCALPFPDTAPLALIAWLQDWDVRVISTEFLGTRRAGQARWFGKFRLILGR